MRASDNPAPIGGDLSLDWATAENFERATSERTVTRSVGAEPSWIVAPNVKLPDMRLTRLRVLVVDDSRYMRNLLKAMLFGIGVGHVIEAGDGAAALTIMYGQRVDLVLVDMKMAPVDGIEFCRRLRSDPDSPNPLLPVLMLTGYTEAIRIRQARDAGVDDVLAKPISLNALHERLIGVFRNPRAYVTAARYVGPDRRRTLKRHRDEERRSNGSTG